MIKSLKEAVEIDRIKIKVAAGQATTTSDVVDMSAFESVMFLIALGTVTATGICTAKIQQSDASGSGFADLEGSSIVSTGTGSSNKIMQMELINPQKRYLKVVAVTSVANVEIDSIVAHKFGAKKVPITANADIDVAEQNIAPAEGTA